MTAVPNPDDFITLDQAAKFIPGADRDTLLRLHRSDRLTVYRPGKEYLTTLADVREAVKVKCHVTPKARGCGSVPLATIEPPHGSSLMEVSNAALDSVLVPRLPKKKTR